MKQNIKFDLNDITLVPAELSSIDSRTNVNTKYDTGFFPLIVAPMDSVIDNNNNHIFNENKLLTCSIRQKNIQINSKYNFNGISLQQFEELALGKSAMIGSLNNVGILVDIASGNLLKLHNLVIEFKKIYPEIPLMIGNIANPKTYAKYCEILTDIDYIRCSIGSGTVCTTASNTGIYYPMGSLIEECYEYSCQFNSPPKIVADGGFRNFDEIIKALNLGCFLPNMQVNTSKGLKCIKNIKIGDLVYTHNGKLQKVINKFIYDNKKDIVNINGIYSTDNHHYYVVNKKFADIVNDNNIHEYAEWIQAIDLNDNYLLIKNDTKHQHSIIKFLRTHLFNIYIIYKKIIGELNEK